MLIVISNHSISQVLFVYHKSISFSRTRNLLLVTCNLFTIYRYQTILIHLCRTGKLNYAASISTTMHSLQLCREKKIFFFGGGEVATRALDPRGLCRVCRGCCYATGVNGNRRGPQFDRESVPCRWPVHREVTPADGGPCTWHNECPAVRRPQLPPDDDGRDRSADVIQVGRCQSDHAGTVQPTWPCQCLDWTNQTSMSRRQHSFYLQARPLST